MHLTRTFIMFSFFGVAVRPWWIQESRRLGPGHGISVLAETLVFGASRNWEGEWYQLQNILVLCGFY